jgi:hypothetical protein
LFRFFKELSAIFLACDDDDDDEEEEDDDIDDESYKDSVVKI